MAGRSHVQSLPSVQSSRSVISNSVTPWSAARQAPLSIPNSWKLALNSCPSSRRFHPTIWSSVVPFSSRLRSCPASKSLPRFPLELLTGHPGLARCGLRLHCLPPSFYPPPSKATFSLSLSPLSLPGPVCLVGEHPPCGSSPPSQGCHSPCPTPVRGGHLLPLQSGPRFLPDQTPQPERAPGGDVGSRGSNSAGSFSLHVECSGSRRGRTASRLGWRGSRVALEGLCEQAGPGLRSCSEITDGGKARRPLPHHLLFAPLQRPSRSSRLSQNSPGLYLCPSSARTEKAVRKEFRQKETCWRDTSFFPRKYNLFLTASSHVGLTL